MTQNKARGNSRPNYVRLSDAALGDDFFFLKNLFYQKQCICAMDIGILKSEVPFHSFVREIVPFHNSAGRCIQYLK